MKTWQIVAIIVIAVVAIAAIAAFAPPSSVALPDVVETAVPS